MNVISDLKKTATRVDKAMSHYLPNGRFYPLHLSKAMRYSIFSGGKRVRPYLVIEAAKMCGGSEKKAMPFACAVEMVHAYSLVHDDLPAMDDDDYRRGRKTCHRAFDEATAILAGDGLLSLAFQVISQQKGHSKMKLSDVVAILSKAIGPYGMVGGQAADLRYQKGKKSLHDLKKINRLKTGALITASVEIGALVAGASAKQLEKATQYGQNVGFLFQLVDDIIDRDGYAKLVGVTKTYRKAAEVRDAAIQNLKGFKHRGQTLVQFANFLYERKK